jgi:hypothetical protein
LAVGRIDELGDDNHAARDAKTSSLPLKGFNTRGSASSSICKRLARADSCSPKTSTPPPGRHVGAKSRCVLVCTIVTAPLGSRTRTDHSPPCDCTYAM